MFNSKYLVFIFVLTTSCSPVEEKSFKMTVGKDRVFNHDGMERTYKIYQPKELQRNAPTLFLLHGMGSSNNWSYMAGFNDLAEKHGFLAVYPQSHKKLITFDKSWDRASGKKSFVDPLMEKVVSCENGDSFTWGGMDFICEEGLVSTYNVRWNESNEDSLFDGQSDVQFLSALARTLQTEFDLNAEKTFVAGFSNGGYMSYSLMCQAGGVFKAAAVVSGLIDANVFRNCALNEPKHIIHIHGVDDQMVPIDGGDDKNKQPSALEIVEFFASLNGSNTVETSQSTKNAQLTRYKPTSGGAEVHYYRIENHDHVWPRGDTDAKKIQDDSGLYASELIWNFFSEI
jgi:polyhydroxybutyrate depolymerase